LNAAIGCLVLLVLNSPVWVAANRTKDKRFGVVPSGSVRVVWQDKVGKKRENLCLDRGHVGMLDSWLLAARVLLSMTPRRVSNNGGSSILEVVASGAWVVGFAAVTAKEQRRTET
jgi:hypothetical protein